MNKKGFTVVEIIIAVLIVAILGILGYRIYNERTKDSADSVPATSETSEQSASEPGDAPEIKSSADLDSAATTLDSYDISNDMSELDAAEQEFNAQ